MYSSCIIFPQKIVFDYLGHGGWSSWKAWTTCSLTCGNGIKTRQRACDNPKPHFGGLNCKGLEEESMLCKNAIICSSNFISMTI